MFRVSQILPLFLVGGTLANCFPSLSLSFCISKMGLKVTLTWVCYKVWWIWTWAGLLSRCPALGKHSILVGFLTAAFSLFSPRFIRSVHTCTIKGWPQQFKKLETISSMENLSPSSHFLHSVFLLPVGIFHIVPAVGEAVPVLLFPLQRHFLRTFWAARKASWSSFLITVQSQ